MEWIVNWTITTKTDQFSAKNVAALREMATMGTISGGDLIQRPNSKEWHYAFELPELQEYVSPPEEPPKPSKGYGRTVIGILLFAAAGYFFNTAIQYRSKATESISILGKSELKSTEGLILPTEALLYDEAYGNTTKGKLEKHTKISLKNKKNDRFYIKSEKGNGWVRSKDVVPGYLFLTSESEKLEKINFFNPHKLLKTNNLNWRGITGEPNAYLEFELQNKSGFDVENIRFEIIYKDKYGKEFDSKIIELKGFLEKDNTTTVGTIKPADESGLPIYTTREYFKGVLERDDPNLGTLWEDAFILLVDSSFTKDAEMKLSVINADVME